MTAFIKLVTVIVVNIECQPCCRH